MEWRDVVDVSSFLLFESSGDSEDMASLKEDMDGAEADDAQSCSCDLSDDLRVNEFYDIDHHDTEFVHHDYNDHNNINDDDDDDEEGIDEEWSSGNVVVMPSSTVTTISSGIVQQKKSKVYVDSTMEMLNERDKDKLFWETCLAS